MQGAGIDHIHSIEEGRHGARNHSRVSYNFFKIIFHVPQILIFFLYNYSPSWTDGVQTSAFVFLGELVSFHVVRKFPCSYDNVKGQNARKKAKLEKRGISISTWYQKGFHQPKVRPQISKGQDGYENKKLYEI